MAVVACAEPTAETAQLSRSRTLLVAGILAARRDDMPMAREFLLALEREGLPAHYRELAEAIAASNPHQVRIVPSVSAR